MTASGGLDRPARTSGIAPIRRYRIGPVVGPIRPRTVRGVKRLRSGYHESRHSSRPTDDDAMTRLSGIPLLASGIVLWALAVWMFGAPPPEATGTAAIAPADTVEKSGADEASRPDATPASPSSAQVAEGSTTPPKPDAAVAISSSQADPADPAGIGDTASMPPVPPVPPAATPEVPAAAEGSRIALAPASPQAGDPLAPRVPRTGGAPGSPDRPGGSDSPPVSSAPPDPWLERGYAPPPPARPAHPAMNGGAVASQINSARRAAWEGRPTDALAHYRAAARIAPNNHVVWGEMGNVLWSMRRWSEAAYALEGAATLLIRAGELRAASELVPAVERIDPDAAYRVQRLLWTAAQRQSG